MQCFFLQTLGLNYIVVVFRCATNRFLEVPKPYVIQSSVLPYGMAINAFFIEMLPTN